MSYYLGIDVGTTVMKAEVTDEEGRSISFAFVKYKTVQKKGDSVEQEAGEWWNKLKKVIEKVTRNGSSPILVVIHKNFILKG